jgi:hypothetical protein
VLESKAADGREIGVMLGEHSVPILEKAKAQFQKSWTSGKRGRSWKRASGSAAALCVVARGAFDSEDRAPLTKLFQFPFRTRCDL